MTLDTQCTVSGNWTVGARTETGFVRNENQDRMTRAGAAFGDIYVVSDGMGGHRGGALAAEMTVQVLVDQLLQTRDIAALPAMLTRAFEQANRAIYERGHAGDPETEGMGATAVVLLACGQRVMIAHVGDSRAYLFTRRGQLRPLTKDHTLVQRMVDAGTLSPTEAAAHPQASVLERALGPGPTINVDISPWLRLHEGDHILLCSDGLSGYVDDTEIAAVLRTGGSPQILADQLVQVALSKGGEDNVTVQLMRYGYPSARRRKPRVLDQLLVIPTAIGVTVATAFVTHDYLQSSLAERPSVKKSSSGVTSEPKAGLEKALGTPSSELKKLSIKVNLLEKRLNNVIAERRHPTQAGPQPNKSATAPINQMQSITNPDMRGGTQGNALPSNITSAPAQTPIVTHSATDNPSVSQPTPAPSQESGEVDATTNDGQSNSAPNTTDEKRP